MVPAASNTGTVTTCGEEQEGHLAVARVILPSVGGDRRGGGGGGLRGGAEAGSDIDGDTGAAPGEGYHRANGKRSSNELSWGGGEAEEEEEEEKKAPLSLPNVRVKGTRRESRRAQTQTRQRLALMSAVTLLPADPRARKP